jgi:threonyl-tRNA synthetase
MRQVLIESGINYVEVANEAAFYGPKIDVQVWRCLHTATTSAANSPSPPTRWTSPCPLVAVRKDFGLTYRAKDNWTPLCIHRAPLGTHERFIGGSQSPASSRRRLHAGNFPLSLAPDQVRIHTMLVIGGRDTDG